MSMIEDVTPDSSPETESAPLVEETVSEDVNTPEETTPPKVEEKVVPYSRFKEVKDELTRLKEAPKPQVKGELRVEDYINISAALDGLDPREKARLAEEHRHTGMPLNELRESEDFQLWQSAYRQKMEKENALKPSATQAMEPPKPSVRQEFSSAKSLAEQEELLRKYGLLKENKPRGERVNIGQKTTL